jgi:hypothetical protein
MGGDDPKWLTSAEARKLLKISTCDLAHLREAGRLRFTKQGNAYLYSAADCSRARNVGRESGAASCSIDLED